MITKLNLASKPFRNRTLPYLLALFLLAITVAGAIVAFTQLREATKTNDVISAEIIFMNTEVETLTARGEKVQQELSPGQQSLLIAGHKLAANKSFGWSRLFADLEAVLPGSVSASRINVQNVFRDGDKIKAELEFSVLSQNYQSVMEMIDRMNNSGVFKAELRGQDLREAETITYTEYSLYIIYAQRGVYLSQPVTVEEDDDKPSILNNVTSVEGGKK